MTDALSRRSFRHSILFLFQVLAGAALWRRPGPMRPYIARPNGLGARRGFQSLSWSFQLGWSSDYSYNAMEPVRFRLRAAGAPQLHAALPRRSRSPMSNWPPLSLY